MHRWRRIVVEQAKGVLMERLYLPADVAFEAAAGGRAPLAHEDPRTCGAGRCDTRDAALEHAIGARFKSRKRVMPTNAAHRIGRQVRKVNDAEPIVGPKLTRIDRSEPSAIVSVASSVSRSGR
jgi:hypothetical protein